MVQKLLFPQEIEVWYVLPAIRRAITLEMIRLGVSQKKIAQVLGVTEAAVSQYKKDKRAQEVEFDCVAQEEVRQAVQRIIKDDRAIFNEVMSLNKLLKDRGVFCQIHKRKSITPKNCEAVCQEFFFE